MRYEIVGREIANKYFVIDPDTGVLRIRDDLRKETNTEYQVIYMYIYICMYVCMYE